MNNLYKSALKLSVIILIVFLIWDKIDLVQIKKFLESPLIIAMIIMAWILNLLLTIFRLYLILLTFGGKFNFISLSKAITSSMFVGNLLPGVIGADAIKFLYIKNLDATFGKARLALSLLLDRVLGLVAILFWCSVGGLLLLFCFRERFSGDLQILLYLPSLILVGTVSLFFLTAWYFRFSKISSTNSRFNRLIQDFSLMISGCDKRGLVLTIGSSLLAVLILLLALVFVGAFLSSDANLEEGLVQFFLIPLVLFSSMIPLAPLGIGLAQLTMAGAYELFGLQASVGISVSTASQLALLFVTLVIGGASFLVNTKPANR